MRNNQSNLAHLTPELLANGAVRAHNFESFGRAIVAEALRQGEASFAEVDAAGTKIPTEITIRPSCVDRHRKTCYSNISAQPGNLACQSFDMVAARTGHVGVALGPQWGISYC